MPSSRERGGVAGVLLFTLLKISEKITILHLFFTVGICVCARWLPWLLIAVRRGRGSAFWFSDWPQKALFCCLAKQICWNIRDWRTRQVVGRPWGQVRLVALPARSPTPICLRNNMFLVLFLTILYRGTWYSPWRKRELFPFFSQRERIRTAIWTIKFRVRMTCCPPSSHLPCNNLRTLSSFALRGLS